MRSGGRAHTTGRSDPSIDGRGYGALFESLHIQKSAQAIIPPRPDFCLNATTIPYGALPSQTIPSPLCVNVSSPGAPISSQS